MADANHDHVYNDSHIVFVQIMLSHRLVSEELAMTLYDQACELTQVEKVDFGEFLASINREISDLDLSLRRSRDERDGRSIVGLVNTKEDAVAQLATNYKPDDISYVRQLIELIIMADDENYAANSKAALELGPKMKPPMTKKETQDLLDLLVEDSWLVRSRDGWYVLSTRATLELQGYLREQYGEMIKECNLCLDVITMGERCERQNCPVRIHRHCANNLASGSSTATCPTCTTAWSRANTFGLGLPL